jgi:hypothetical protein
LPLLMVAGCMCRGILGRPLPSQGAPTSAAGTSGAHELSLSAISHLDG